MANTNTPVKVAVNEIPRDCGLSQDDLIALARHAQESANV